MSDLINFLEQNFTKYISIYDNKQKIQELDASQASAMYRALYHEIDECLTEDIRDIYFNDLYIFDNNLKEILSAILASKTSIDEIDDLSKVSLFDRNYKNELNELNNLKKDGYKKSGHFLSNESIEHIKKELSQLDFVNRGVFEKRVLGKKL